MEEGNQSAQIKTSDEGKKESKGPRRANVEVEFDSNKKKFNDLKQSKNKDAMKRWRVDIMRQTIDISYAQNYILNDGTVVPLPDPTKAISKNVFYIPEHLDTLHAFTKSEVPDEHDTIVEVENMDCVELGIDLIQKSYNPIILNMASHKRPGGGYMTGAGAQEENIFRRSNYFQHLQDLEKKYPMHGAIYSPNVTVFRSNEDPDGYALLKSPIQISFVAVAAFAHPKTIDVVKNGIKIKELDKDAATKTKQKIRYILDVALYHKHDAIVLSAFGCGAFANPPGHMARLFKEVINTEYRKKFKYIGFAILDDANAQRNNAEGNFKPFYNVFNEK